LLADMTIALYAAECTLLRTLKHLTSGTEASNQLRLDITRAWCRALPETIERLGSSVLAAAVEGDALHLPLAALRKLTRVTPINRVALKRQIAAAAIESERYPLG
jgi:hypothetical protein